MYPVALVLSIIDKFCKFWLNFFPLIIYFFYLVYDSLIGSKKLCFCEKINFLLFYHRKLDALNWGSIFCWGELLAEMLHYLSELVLNFMGSLLFFDEFFHPEIITENLGHDFKGFVIEFKKSKYFTCHFCEILLIPNIFMDQSAYFEKSGIQDCLGIEGIS